MVCVIVFKLQLIFANSCLRVSVIVPAQVIAWNAKDHASSARDIEAQETSIHHELRSLHGLYGVIAKLTERMLIGLFPS